MSDESPIFRVQTGIDPNNANANPNQVAYAHVKLRFAAGHAGAASEKAGRAVYDKVLILTHIYPGTTDSLDVEIKRYPEGGDPIIVDAARAGYIDAKASPYLDLIEQFEKRGAAAQTGTPLAAINLDPAQVANLGGMGIQTVEALADVPDSNLGRLGMGARALRDRAMTFQQAASGNAPIAALQSRNEGLEAEMAEMRRTVKELQDLLRSGPAAADPAPAADLPKKGK